MARPAVERLEQRCLLAAEFGPLLQDGTLFLFLDGENDQVSFGLPDAATARLTLNGAVFDYAPSDVRFLLFTGGGGNDQIQVASDVTIAAALDGEDGNDHLVGGAAEDLLGGGLGNDTMLGGAGDDVIDAVDGFLCFYDSFGNEICGPPPASQSRDSVDAGAGDDFVRGDATNDTLDGGGGDNDIDTGQGDSNCVQVSMSYSAVEPVSQADTVLFAFPDPSTARVTVNGNTYEFEQSQVVCFMADAEAGNDSIQIDASVPVPATLWGGEGNDTLAGGSGDDSFYGGDGDDSLLGNAGNDTLSGEAGSDSVDGGDGNDSLDGGVGSDSVSGGAGDDAMADSMGDDTLDGGGGNDVFNLTPGSDDNVWDTLGTNTLSFAGSARGITIDLGLAAGQRQTVDGARNTVSLRGVFHHVIGSALADDLTGNEHANRLEGGGGDDTLDGGGGDPNLRGQSNGRAPDRRSGGGCDGDTLVGQAGHDWLDGGRGRDRLDGGDGDDVLVGDPARDTLSGGAGANREIRVAKNSARCSASGGSSARSRSGRGVAVPGNAAPSPVHFDPISGVLRVQGDADGPSDDVIVVSTGGEESRRRTPVEVIINGIVRSSQRGSGHFDAALAGATVKHIQAIEARGLEENDHITIRGVFKNANGRVTLDGGAGADTLLGSALSEVFLGSDGDDRISAGSGHDSILAGAGQDTLIGGRGSDMLVGGTGEDSVLDQAKDDTLLDGPITFDAATGLLTVTGDESGITNDHIVVVFPDPQGPACSDVGIMGIGACADASVFGKVVINGVLYSSDPRSPDFHAALGGATVTAIKSVLVQGREGNDRIEVLHWLRTATISATLDGGPGDDLLRGGLGGDLLAGGSDNDTLEGADGPDSLDGGSGIDQVTQVASGRQALTDRTLSGLGTDVLEGVETASLVGGTGDDVIDASGFILGPVTLSGGAGNDTLVGGLLHDQMLGGDGDDVLSGEDGNDRLTGGMGNDTIDGGVGLIDIVQEAMDVDFVLTDSSLIGLGLDALRNIEAANLVGGDGNNTLDASRFSSGPVSLNGGWGNDSLVGGPREDRLEGLDGNDTLIGGAGDDDLLGGPGSDSLSGGLGTDTLFGDEVLGMRGQDTLDGGPESDRILRDLVDPFHVDSGFDSDEVLSDASDVVEPNGPFVVGSHHAVAGHGGRHFMQPTADGHHIRWADQNPATPGVIDILYDFRNQAGFANDITDNQRALAVNALNLWRNASNGSINFVQNVDAAAQNIINIGTGDLQALGDVSEPDGTLGLGGGVFNHDANHTVASGVAWMDVDETWNDVIGDGNPANTYDWFTIAVQEIGHALGLDHLDNLAGLDMMDGTYVQEQTAASTNDSRHIRIVYGGNVQIEANADGNADAFRVVRNDDLLEVFVNGNLAFSADFHPVTEITINGSNDNDTLTVDYADGAIGRRITFSGGGGTDRINVAVDADQTLDTESLTNTLLDTVAFTSVERAELSGGDGNNMIDASLFTDDVTLDGGSGDDTLLGGTDRDSLTGGPGNDSVSGGADDDTVVGSAGDDTLAGQDGSDSIDGGTGTDRLSDTASGKIALKDGQLVSQAGTDTFIGIEQVSLSGGNMKDTITAKKFTLGSVTITGGAGDDAITGTNAADTIKGDAGNDTIKEVNGADYAEGGDGNDNLNGGNENDTLLGEGGADKLTGGKGDDSLDGGVGRDTLNGSAGVDICVAGPTNEGDSIKGCEA